MPGQVVAQLHPDADLEVHVGIEDQLLVADGGTGDEAGVGGDDAGAAADVVAGEVLTVLRR